MYGKTGKTTAVILAVEETELDWYPVKLMYMRRMEGKIAPEITPESKNVKETYVVVRLKQSIFLSTLYFN